MFGRQIFYFITGITTWRLHWPKAAMCIKVNPKNSTPNTDRIYSILIMEKLFGSHQACKNQLAKEMFVPTYTIQSLHRLCIKVRRNISSKYGIFSFWYPTLSIEIRIVGIQSKLYQLTTFDCYQWNTWGGKFHIKTARISL